MKRKKSKRKRNTNSKRKRMNTLYRRTFKTPTKSAVISDDGTAGWTFTMSKCVKRGGKVIASGNSSCVFFPALQCADSSITEPNMVTKLMLHTTGEREYDKFIKIKTKLETIPNYRSFFLLDITKCKPSPFLPEDLENYEIECGALIKQGITKENINSNLDKLVALNIPYGGIQLDDFIYGVDTNNSASLTGASLTSATSLDISSLLKIRDIHLNLVDLLRNGILEMNKRNVYHCDIKSSNILVSKTEETINLKIIDWGLSTEYNPASKIKIPFIANIPNVWRNRPLIFNMPFSNIIFADKFSMNYTRFIQNVILISTEKFVENISSEEGRIDMGEQIKPFVKKFVEDGKNIGHYEFICQTMNLLFEDQIQNDPEITESVETLTMEYIVDYIVDVLVHFTEFDGVFLNFKLYLDRVFIRIVDIWGLVMSYYPILKILSQNPDSKAFLQLQFIFVEYLYNPRNEPIDMDVFYEDLDNFEKQIERHIANENKKAILHKI